MILKRTQNKKIIFMGTPDFAVHSLQALIDGKYNVVAVITAPDRKKGRGQKMTIPPIKQLALAKNIEVIQPIRIKNKQWVEKIKSLAPDIIIVAAYGQIIPKSILKIPKYGCINVHASLLPKYRGASPIHYALIDGEKETGITIMKMDAGMDTGEIITNEKLRITNEDNLASLHDRLAEAGAKLLVRTLPDYIGGKIKLVKQDNNKATYADILEKKDGKIDWNQSGEDVVNMVRAFNPWPGTFTDWNGRCLKIIEARLADRELKPGEVKIIENKIYIGTKDKSVQVIRLQLEGKKCLIAEDFVRGCSMIDGYYCR